MDHTLDVPAKPQDIETAAKLRVGPTVVHDICTLLNRLLD